MGIFSIVSRKNGTSHTVALFSLVECCDCWLSLIQISDVVSVEKEMAISFGIHLDYRLSRGIYNKSARFIMIRKLCVGNLLISTLVVPLATLDLLCEECRASVGKR